MDTVRKLATGQGEAFYKEAGDRSGKEDSLGSTGQERNVEYPEERRDRTGKGRYLHELDDKTRKRSRRHDREGSTA